MMGHARGVVFDLDGTLLDTRDTHLSCLRAACAAVGFPAPSLARMLSAQRGTDTATVVALVGEARARAASTAYQETLLAQLELRPPAPMPGVTATLRTMRQQGIPVGVCTGRSRDGAAALLHASRLDVKLLVAREDAPRPKPAPDGLLAAVGLLGLAPEAALFVGDSALDAKQGLASGIRTVLVGPAVRGLSGVGFIRTVAEVTV